MKTWQQAAGIIITGIVLFLIVTGIQRYGNEKGLLEIQRDMEQDDSYQIVMETETEDGRKKEVMLTVPPKTYGEETIQEWFQKGREQLPDYILGENPSLDHVNQKLQLISQIPETEVSVSWASSDTEILDWEGNIGSKVSTEGSDVTLYVTFRCQDQLEEFELLLTVYPDLQSENQWEKEVQKQFDAVNQDATGDVLYLPQEVMGEKIQWKYPPGETGKVILLFAVVLALAVAAGKQQEELQKKQKQQAEMLKDYPEILNKFTLLLNAGLNTRKAFAKIALDYRKEAGKPRAAYDVINAVYVEMEQGVPEIEAYEHLGKRCSLPEYKTFSTLLVQNLRKGNQELLETLEREAIDAFENRKRRARILGEKAGTKLLFPMMGMLLIVFVILLVPAWTSFGV